MSYSPNTDGRPDYSPREKRVLRDQQFSGTKWQTAESSPRPVKILGRASVDPDVSVVRIGGDEKSYWLMSCGSSFDGSIIGTEPDRIWIREI